MDYDIYDLVSLVPCIWELTVSLPQNCPVGPRKRKPKKAGLEAEVLKEGLQWLRQHGLFVWRSNTGGVKFDDGGFMKFGFVGSADITGILPSGRRLECEAKRRVGGKQSLAQKEFQDRIESNGGSYVLFHSVEELAEKLIPVLQQTGVWIPLTQGEFARIDFQDWPLISQHKWQASLEYKMWYAKRSVAVPKKRTIRMPREILGLEHGDGIWVDHINGDGLDNRRGNLRICTPSENSANQKMRSDSHNNWKGVKFDARPQRQKRWVARITQNGKEIFIGYFDTELEAAKAYDKKARELFGEFACPNFPEEQE